MSQFKWKSDSVPCNDVPEDAFLPELANNELQIILSAFENSPEAFRKDCDEMLNEFPSNYPGPISVELEKESEKLDDTIPLAMFQSRVAWPSMKRLEVRVEKWPGFEKEEK